MTCVKLVEGSNCVGPGSAETHRTLSAREESGPEARSRHSLRRSLESRRNRGFDKRLSTWRDEQSSSRHFAKDDEEDEEDDEELEIEFVVPAAS